MTEAIERHYQQEAEAMRSAEVIDFPRRQQQGLEFAELDMPEVPEKPSAADRVPALARAARQQALVAARGTARAARAARPHAAQGGRFTARHGVFLVGGMWDVVSESYKRATHRDIDESIRAAQRDGDHGTAAQLLQQKVAHRKVLLERWQVLGKFLIRAPIGVGLIAGTTLLITFVCSVVGLFQQGTDGFTATWSEFGTAMVSGWEWMTWAATTVIPAVGGLALVGLVLSGYNRRRLAGNAPQWMQVDAATRHEDTLKVTSDGVVKALRTLRIPALDKAFKDGWEPKFLLPPTREGEGNFKGYRVIFETPDGVTPQAIADKNTADNPVLAKNLKRNAIEVSVSDYGQQKGGQPGYVNMYVADFGVMGQPTPAWPLLSEGTADVFAGVPMGITQRGEPVLFPLVESNVVFGGAPGQGKSNGVRSVLLGAALDPLCEIRVFVFAGNGDFDAYQPRLAAYGKGATEENCAAAVETLAELYEEMERREARLSELSAKKLTRGIAAEHADLRPLVLALSECHELFGHEEHGERAAKLATAIIKRARKLGITLVLDTQSARKEAIPPSVVEHVGINCCFYVKSWRNNDGFLGDGSFAAGIRATNLRFGTDRGSMVVTGATEELWEIVRTHYIEADDDTGWDSAADVIARAMELVEGNTPVGGQRPAPAEPEQRDLLADLDQVLGTETVSAAEAAKTLAGRFGKAYHRKGPKGSMRPMTASQLVAELAEVGVQVPSTGNKHPVDPAEVRSALARIATVDLDDEPTGRAG